MKVVFCLENGKRITIEGLDINCPRNGELIYIESDCVGRVVSVARCYDYARSMGDEFITEYASVILEDIR